MKKAIFIYILSGTILSYLISIAQGPYGNKFFSLQVGNLIGNIIIISCAIAYIIYLLSLKELKIIKIIISCLGVISLLIFYGMEYSVISKGQYVSSGPFNLLLAKILFLLYIFHHSYLLYCSYKDKKNKKPWVYKLILTLIATPFLAGFSLIGFGYGFFIPLCILTLFFILSLSVYVFFIIKK